MDQLIDQFARSAHPETNGSHFYPDLMINLHAGEGEDPQASCYILQPKNQAGDTFSHDDVMDWVRSLPESKDFPLYIYSYQYRYSLGQAGPDLHRMSTSGSSGNPGQRTLRRALVRRTATITSDLIAVLAGLWSDTLRQRKG
nr:hypothetical protein [uncultured Rhodopila sp.]